MQNSEFGDDDFKAKREEFSIRIRKQKREEVFNTKRFTGNEMDKMIEEDPSKRPNASSVIVLDSRYQKQIKEMAEQNFMPKNFDGLVILINSKDPLQMHRAIIGFRKLTSRQQDVETINNFVQKGLIDKAIEFLNQQEYPQLRMQAVWTLANIASGSSECCQKLIEKGMIELFLSLINQNQKGVVDQAVWGIGNLAAQSAKIRDMLLKSGAMTNLIQLLISTNNQPLQKNIVWAICNLCRGSPRPSLMYVSQAIPILCKAALLQRLPDQIQGDCYMALANMTHIKEDKAIAIIQSGLLPLLIRTVGSSDKQILYLPALKIIGNMSMCAEFVETLIKNGLFSIAIFLLDHQKLNVRREICWILSNVLSFKEITLKFLSNEILRKKIARKFRQEQHQVKRQLCWVISNIVHTGKRKIVSEYMAQQQIMQCFVILLGEQQADTFTKQSCLECLGRILKVGDHWAKKNINIFAKAFEHYGGGNKLQALQYHSQTGILDRVKEILQKYYDLENAMID